MQLRPSGHCDNETPPRCYSKHSVFYAAAPFGALRRVLLLKSPMVSFLVFYAAAPFGALRLN